MCFVQFLIPCSLLNTYSSGLAVLLPFIYSSVYPGDNRDIYQFLQSDAFYSIDNVWLTHPSIHALVNLNDILVIRFHFRCVWEKKKKGWFFGPWSNTHHFLSHHSPIQNLDSIWYFNTSTIILHFIFSCFIKDMVSEIMLFLEKTLISPQLNYSHK